MASTTTTSQGAANFNCYWGMIGSEDNSGFNTSVNSNSVNQSLTNCQQAASLDYSHSAYSTGSTGYPASYYAVSSGSAYGSAAAATASAAAASATLYQQLAATSASTMAQLINWDQTADEENKSKLTASSSSSSSSKKSCHYSFSESNSHYVHHPHHPFDTTSSKSTFDLLSAHHTSSSSKKGSIASMANNSTTAQAPNFNYYWGMCGSDDNSGFVSGSSNTSVNPMANCAQGSLDYPYNPYNQTNPWYPYYTNQGYGTTASPLYQLAAHIPTATSSTPMGSLLTASSWDGIDQDESKSLITSSKHQTSSSNGTNSNDSNNNTNTNNNNSTSNNANNNSSSNVNNANSNNSDNCNNNNATSNNSSGSKSSNLNASTSISNQSNESNNTNVNTSNASAANSVNGNVNNSSTSTTINTNNSGNSGFSANSNSTNSNSTNTSNSNSSNNTNCVNSNSNSNSSNATNSTSIGNSSKKHCAYYLNENPTHHYSNVHHPLDTNQTITPKLELITNHPNPSKKGTTKAGRGRGRRQPTQSPDLENHLERVFIWDLDETLIIFTSLLNGTFASKTGKDGEALTQLGLLIDAMMLNMADLHFFANDLLHCDQIHIDDVSSDDNGQDLSSYDFSKDGFNEATRSNNMGCLPSAGTRSGIDWMRKLAFRYRRIKEIYDQYRNNVSSLLGNKANEWMHIRSEIENLTDNWLTFAIKCLTIINERPNCVNVLVTDSNLVPALVKLLLHGLGPFFPIDNIYSAAKVGKDPCFNKIKDRFGSKCTYVVIGDGQFEESAAKSLGMPFWKVDNHAALINLHHALEQDIL
ncbi:eyes absent homolog 1 isoform X1 [Tetranychus urticae]|uniref:Eyes absent homolog n=1 Tax=Tetranychus urticae TaxID=32264 RepID=T1JTM4_TETUR|nr:eyes absent homolog 1 isoform X1 [Tetranychus urticae]XP_015786177.1 eyes absent homolog 1 isoform X1 [Tetranychus urticae]XP_015786187.1 eyes absent homolog 1 isoform X1 [Tetranychus urticae]